MLHRIRSHTGAALLEMATAAGVPDPSETLIPMNWAVWRGSEIPLWNFLPFAWESRVLTLIDAFNLTLPEKGPCLVYRPQSALRYAAIQKRQLARRGITVCIDDQLPDDVAGRVAPFAVRGDDIIRAVVRIHPGRDPYEDPLCHELMHALTYMDDIPEGEELPCPADSCIPGHLGEPGPFDRRFVRWVYAKAKRRRKAERSP